MQLSLFSILYRESFMLAESVFVKDHASLGLII